MSEIAALLFKTLGILEWRSSRPHPQSNGGLVFPGILVEKR
jgi:hypothetical protein